MLWNRAEAFFSRLLFSGVFCSNCSFIACSKDSILPFKSPRTTQQALLFSSICFHSTFYLPIPIDYHVRAFLPNFLPSLIHRFLHHLLDCITVELFRNLRLPIILVDGLFELGSNSSGSLLLTLQNQVKNVLLILHFLFQLLQLLRVFSVFCAGLRNYFLGHQGVVLGVVKQILLASTSPLALWFFGAPLRFAQCGASLVRAARWLYIWPITRRSRSTPSAAALSQQSCRWLSRGSSFDAGKNRRFSDSDTDIKRQPYLFYGLFNLRIEFWVCAHLYIFLCKTRINSSCRNRQSMPRTFFK